MNILVAVAHPKHVHIFRNFIKIMVDRGHEVKIVAVDKDVTEYLLKQYGLFYTFIGKNQPGLIRKGMSMINRELLTFKIAKKFDPDIFVGRAFPELAHVSVFLKKPFIVFEDTEIAKIVHKITIPFTDCVVTPLCYKGSFGEKHVRFNGYFELAYLHPNYFKLDASVLDDLGLSKDDKFIIIRLVSWEATHDAHSRGFSKDLERIIKSLEEYGHIFITSERKLNSNLDKYKIQIPPEKLHSALYYASLYFGEGGTTAVEAALLGTPSVHVVAFKTKSGEVADATKILGNFDELVNKYGMLYTFADPDPALNKALEILQDKNAKKEMRKKREKLLREKIDVTAFMTDFIENYPESFYEYMQRKGHERRKGQ